MVCIPINFLLGYHQKEGELTRSPFSAKSVKFDKIEYEFEKIEQAYDLLLENVQTIQNQLGTNIYDAMIEQMLLT